MEIHPDDEGYPYGVFNRGPDGLIYDSDWDDPDWDDLEPSLEELDKIAAEEGQYTAWEIIDANQHRLMET